jgi:hypothetical protein
MAMPAGSSRQQQAAAGSSRQQQRVAARTRSLAQGSLPGMPLTQLQAVTSAAMRKGQRASGQAGWPSGAGWPRWPCVVCGVWGGRLRTADCWLKTETPLPPACCLLPVGCGLWLRLWAAGCRAVGCGLCHSCGLLWAVGCGCGGCGLWAVGCGLWAVGTAGAAGKLGVGSWELEVGRDCRKQKAVGFLCFFNAVTYAAELGPLRHTRASSPAATGHLPPR